MNYLSHLFFSQRTPLSMTGNLMGDFKPDAELFNRLPKEIILGIKNHRFVDRETDKYLPVKELRPLFAPERRRFVGIVTDIAFDYFLIKHWDDLAIVEFPEFVQSCYSGLEQSRQWMPPRMSYVTAKMQEHDWLSTYATMDGISKTIDQVSKRIRFKNNLAGSVVEVTNNYEQIESVFLELFKHLTAQVKKAKIEYV